jgi:colanic acid/amylovoran biosynthesis glycosyltransferase
LPLLLQRRPGLAQLGHGLQALARKAPDEAFRLVRRATAVLEQRPFDVIVCHFGPVGVDTQSLRDLGVTDAPMATFFHGYDVSRSIDEYGKSLYRRLFARCELLLPISEYWREKLVRLGAPGERMAVHRMGVDCSKIPFVPRVLLPDESPQLLSVARLTEKKGLEYALRAMSSIQAQFSDFHYHIVGDGELRPALERLIRELDLVQRVTLHGWKSQAQVAQIRDRSHILLQPSVTASDGDQEGIPVALMEALAAGMPVLSTFHTGIPELVEHGRSGYLVAERDSEALATRILELLRAPETWPSFAREGRKKVEAEFDISVLNDQLAERLRRLVSS